MKNAHFKKLEKMYLNANINSEFFESTEIEISDKSARISIDVLPKYFHALGGIHGSVYFKLLDDAAFFAVNSIITDVFVLTSSFNIQFLRPVSSGKITAHGKVRFVSGKTMMAEAVLLNEEGKAVAFGNGNFVRSKVHLGPEIGYA
ncbi:PaaI family thioesterase [Hyphobacterium sp. CCMP332]|nr:PaaI family thioesterase [Hyphobacterium sp. CCMP332]